MSGIVTDLSTIQFRMLNKAKDLQCRSRLSAIEKSLKNNGE